MGRGMGYGMGVGGVSWQNKIRGMNQGREQLGTVRVPEWAAHGIFGELQVGMDPSSRKSFPNPALGAREGLETGAAALG